MSLSYSGLTNYGKSSLPSVEDWGTNTNILRDPPKSIQTRRIDKVSQTSGLTEMIDQSSDRVCENILVYARGTNPSVSVSYSNNNLGLTGTLMPSGGNRQAKLPYTIMNDGAFRPPVVTQYDLAPLSRLPRIWTTSFSKPGFADFSKRMMTCNPDTAKEIKQKTIKTHIRPSAVYMLETPLEQPYETKYNIQTPVKTAVSSGFRSVLNEHGNGNHVQNPILKSPLHSSVFPNVSDIKYNTGENILDTERYTKEVIGAPYETTKTSVDQNNYIHKDLKLERNTPLTQTGSAKSLNIGDTLSHTYIKDLERNTPLTKTGSAKSLNIGDTLSHTYIKDLERNTPLTGIDNHVPVIQTENLSSRQVNLHPKINPGGFINPGQKTRFDRTETYKTDLYTNKMRISEQVNQSIYNRNKINFTRV